MMMMMMMRRRRRRINHELEWGARFSNKPNGFQSQMGMATKNGITLLGQTIAIISM